MVNEKFFKLVYKKIKPHWFLSERNAKLYSLLIAYYTKYAVYPSVIEFKDFSEFLAMEPKDRELLYSFIGRNIADTQQISLEVIRSELTEWLHSIIIMKGMGEASKAYNAKEINKCYQILMTSIREVSDSRFEAADEITFTNYKEYLKESETERVEALTTGLPVLDGALLKGATTGGLQRGDTTVIMAPINIGKTTTLITFSCHNIKAGKDVLFMTHEGRPEDIRNKILANMLGCTIDGLLEYYKDYSKMSIIENTVKMIDKHFRYIPYNKAGMVVEDVVPIIRNAQEDWMALHDGKGFDMLVSDYPALLGTELAKKGNLQKRTSDEIVYDNYVQLALEYKFHSLLAIQTNREGSKVNKGLNGDNRLLCMEDVLESWGPIAKASNVLTLNRSPKCMELDLIIFNIAKSRGNETGVAVMAKSDFKHSMTHSPTLNGVLYSGTRSAEEHYQKLFNDYLGGRVPDNLCRQLGL